MVFASQPLLKALGEIDSWGFSEKTVLALLVDALDRLSSRINKRFVLIVLAHPEESIRDLEADTNRLRPVSGVSFTVRTRTFILFRAADLVTGIFSILLTEAVILKKPVLNLQPGLKREDMLVTNMVGATLPVRKSGDIIGAIAEFITDTGARAALMDRQSRFRIVENANPRWDEMVESLRRSRRDKGLGAADGPVLGSALNA